MSFLCSIIFIFGPRTFIAGRWGKEEETGEWGKHHKQEDWQADLEGDQIVCPSFLAHLEGVIRMNLEENSSQLNLEIRKIRHAWRPIRGAKASRVRDLAGSSLHADPGASEAECELFSRSAIAGDFEIQVFIHPVAEFG
ncbi:uncharacterized protein [Nicotiana sylvestris]|uniref:uncharacterized protein isoform X2 n=1 Tax=Nicotiana sylvestris TaxID=4096 RepID=UPI00388C6639